MKRYTMEVYASSSVEWCQCELDEDGDWVKHDEARLLRKERDDLLEMLKAVTVELEEEVNDTYRCYSIGCNGAMHPAYVRRYERDMSSVRKAQALIAKFEGVEAQP